MFGTHDRTNITKLIGDQSFRRRVAPDLVNVQLCPSRIANKFDQQPRFGVKIGSCMGFLSFDHDESIPYSQWIQVLSKRWLCVRCILLGKYAYCTSWLPASAFKKQLIYMLHWVVEGASCLTRVCLRFFNPVAWVLWGRFATTQEGNFVIVYSLVILV